MTITVAVTGGIGAGKSTVSGLLAARGAVVVDSDRLAREVVGVGTPGLSAVADQFGAGVLDAAGGLDRAALAAIVFTDPAARRRLEAITHPLIRARFEAVRAAAPPGGVVVNDIPLLTTASAAAAFHLVVGVTAPAAVRVARLVDRGLSSDDALARIAAQIDDDARRLLCDVWIDNSAGPAEIRRRVDLLWSRLAEFAANVDAGRGSASGSSALVPYDPQWPAAAARLVARIRHAVGDRQVEHIGPTAVPGFPARDVIDLQLAVADQDQLAAFSPLLIGAGFPPVDLSTVHPPPAITPSDACDSGLSELVCGNADPGRRSTLYLRSRVSPEWEQAVRVRDWLRTDEVGRADYLAVQQAAAVAQPGHPGSGGAAQAQADFLAAADLRSRAWAAQVGWSPS